MARWKKRPTVNRDQPERKLDLGMVALTAVVSGIAAFLGINLFRNGDVLWTFSRHGAALTTLSLFFGVFAFAAAAFAWGTFADWKDSWQAARPKRIRRRRK